MLLLTLAIVDDIGAIAVIAVFYTDDLEPGLLLVALWRSRCRRRRDAPRACDAYPPVLAIMGFALWLVVYESGVHATIAGVVMGVLMPARPIQTELEAEQIVDVLAPSASSCRRCARSQH